MTVSASRPGDITSVHSLETAWEGFAQYLRGAANTDNYATDNDLAKSGFHIFGGLKHPLERRQTERPMALQAFNLPYLDALRVVVPFVEENTSWVDESIATYAGIPPFFRTHFTEQFIGLALLLNGLAHLTPSKLATAADRHMFGKNLVAVKNYIEDAFTDFSQIFTGQRALPSTLIEGVINRFYSGEESLNFYRLHLNMTTLNEKDHTGDLGTIYLKVVLEWLQYRGFRVVQNPENTTFVFLGADADMRVAMQRFSQEVKAIFRDRDGVPADLFAAFEPSAIVTRRKLNIFDVPTYALQTQDDFIHFEDLLTELLPSSHRRMFEVYKQQAGILRVIKRITELVSEFDYEKYDDYTEIESLKSDIKESGLGLTEDEIHALYIEGQREYVRTYYKENAVEIMEQGKSLSPLLQKKLHALLIQGIFGFFKVLAAQTSYFEKEAVTRESLYTEQDLLSSSLQENETWAGYQRRSAGFVGPALYDAGKHVDGFNSVGGLWQDSELYGLTNDLNLPPWLKETLHLVPRRSRYLGYLSHEREGSPGGAIQQLWQSLTHLMLAGDTAVDGVIREVAAKAVVVRRYFENIFTMLRSDDRNPLLSPRFVTYDLYRGQRSKSVHADFFMENVVLSGNNALIVMEIDSFKAYNMAHPSATVDDEKYNTILSFITLTARELGLQDPAIRRLAGDQITISLNTKKEDGSEIDVAAFCRELQKKTKAFFAHQQYQDLQKVSTVSLPLIVNEASIKTIKGAAFFEEMAKHFGFKTIPYMEQENKADEGNHKLMIVMPTDVADLMEATRCALNQLGAFLEGIQLDGQPRLETKRLPVWETKEGHRYAGQQPAYAKPFIRGVTLSLVSALHKPVTDAKSHQRVKATELLLGQAMGGIKEATLPYKEAYAGFEITDDDSAGYAGNASLGSGIPASALFLPTFALKPLSM